jgi:hypothetical protein
MKSDNIIRVLQTVLAAAVAGFAISVVVAGHWWATPPPPPPPPPSVNVAAVAKQVVDLLRTQMTTNDALSKYGITVDDGGLTLINTDLNKYDGLATVHTRKGTQKFLSVTVWADPTGAMFYQMDGVSASNLVEAAKAEEPASAWGN